MRSEVLRQIGQDILLMTLLPATRIRKKGALGEGLQQTYVEGCVLF